MTASHYQRVVVAVDGSEHSGRAAAAAATLAKQMNCPLTLLYVFVAPGPDEFISLDNISGALLDPAKLSPQAMETAKREAGQKAFAVARQSIDSDDLKIEEHVVTGRVVPEILRFAETGAATVLVVGRRGLGRVGEFLLGSVSDKLVRQAKIPVLVV